MRILVTGGAGFVGSALVRRLAEDGHEVRVLDDFSRGHAARLDGVKCDLLPGDVRNPGPVARAVAGCDLVIHLASVQGNQWFYTHPRRVLEVMIRGTMNVIAACERQGADLMLASSSEAHQSAVIPTPEDVPLIVPDVRNPRYSYGGAKITAELLAMAAAHEQTIKAVTIVRPYNVIGPDMGTDHVIPQFAQRVAELAREHPSGVIPFPVQGSGQETRSFCWIGDCVEQLVVLVDHGGGGIWNVGVMDERTIAETAHAVAGCYGRDIEVVPGALAEGSPQRRSPDTAAIEALGWKPAVGFGEAIERTVVWYQARG